MKCTLINRNIHPIKYVCTVKKQMYTTTINLSNICVFCKYFSFCVCIGQLLETLKRFAINNQDPSKILKLFELKVPFIYEKYNLTLTMSK